MSGGNHWQEPTTAQKSGSGQWSRPESAYDTFMREEGIPTYRDIGLRDVRDLALGDWERLGGRGTYIQLDGTEGMWGMYLVELPPGGSLEVERHIYEKIHFVVEGRGSTAVWQEREEDARSFEWNKGSVFAVPLNAAHRISNTSSKPALLLAATSAPNLMNLVPDREFIFANPYRFTNRFAGEADFYAPSDAVEPDPVRGLAMRRTNLIPDMVTCDLPLDNRRSPGYRRIQPQMGNGQFGMFCGQHENGRYSKAHRHPSGAVLVCIGGAGYTYTWPASLGTQPWLEGKGDQVKRQDYRPGGMVSAAPVSGDWYHQHFGISQDPLRLLVFTGPIRMPWRKGRPGTIERDESSIDVKEGGIAIEYRDQDPHIDLEFRRQLAENDVAYRMSEDVWNAHFSFTGQPEE